MTKETGITQDLLDRYGATMTNAFGTPKRVLVRGVGTSVWDADNNRYTDFLSGLAVNSLGHAHPEVLAAISDQLSTLGHVSNFFTTPTQISLAEALVARLGAPGEVFFTNSGTEANETALKLTRLTGRTRVVAMEGSFHGRTMGSLAITHSAKYREPFAPLPGEVTFVPYGDAIALAEVMDDTVAAIVIEPVQGENGVVVPPSEFLAEARRLADLHGSLLWLDEVQTGIGRCGHWFAQQHFGVVGDLVTVAKGLGAGFPIGACIATGAARGLFSPGDHGTTFGGNPVAAAAGLAVLGVIERDGLLENAVKVGDRLASRVLGLNHRLVSEVRGVGLLRGIVFTEPVASSVFETCLEKGWIVNAPRPNVLRVAPPLIVTQAEADAFVEVLAEVLDD